MTRRNLLLSILALPLSLLWWKWPSIAAMPWRKQEAKWTIYVSPQSMREMQSWGIGWIDCYPERLEP